MKYENGNLDHENTEGIQCTATRLKAIADPMRLKILCILDINTLTVKEILEKAGTTQSNISQHLSILRDKGILESRKVSNRVLYRVTDNRVLQMVSLIRSLYCSNQP
jgi:ArsR family transcriptional regulator